MVMDTETQRLTLIKGQRINDYREHSPEWNIYITPYLLYLPPPTELRDH